MQNETNECEKEKKKQRKTRRKPQEMEDAGWTMRIRIEGGEEEKREGESWYLRILES
jgi:hypothetical protein